MDSQSDGNSSATRNPRASASAITPPPPLAAATATSPPAAPAVVVRVPWRWRYSSLTLLAVGLTLAVGACVTVGVARVQQVAAVDSMRERTVHSLRASRCSANWAADTTAVLSTLQNMVRARQTA
jgi:hypothetical protein